MSACAKSISALILALALRPLPLGAFDSSGGKKINDLLARVVFQEGASLERYPILFQWTDENRSRFLKDLKEILAGMPLDVSELEPVERILVTNSAFSAPPTERVNREIARTTRELKSLGDEFSRSLLEFELGFIEMLYGEKDAEWDPAHKVLRFSGPILLGRVGGRFSESDAFFPEVVLHEFMHAWELSAGESASSVPNRTKPFYSLQYVKRSRNWTRNVRKFERDLEKRTAREVEQEFKRFQKDLSQLVARRDKKELTWDQCSQEAKERGDECSSRTAGLVEEKFTKKHSFENQLYETLRLPSRFGGSSGRCWTLGHDNPCDPKAMSTGDKHAMDAPTEYLATLAELLWADPELAEKYYSPDEINWVCHVVFKDRAIQPIAIREEPVQSAPR